MMNRLINVLANIVRGEKYKNTTIEEQIKSNTKHKYQIQTDEQGYMHFTRDNITHRLSGPAIIYRSGFGKYYIDGKELSESEHAEFFKTTNAAESSNEEYAYMRARLDSPD